MNSKYKDILSTFANLFWRLISGPISMILIPLYLSSEEQGYWYLFGSIAALSTFADLGFSNIVLQFSAHEFASLKIDDRGLLSGEEYNIKKIGSFFHFVVHWLRNICSVAFPVIIFVGIFFLARDKVLSIYLIPWIIYSLGSLINFFNNSILSFLEGMNQISKIQKSRLVVAVLNTAIIVIGLILHLKVFTIAIAMFVSSSFMFLTIFKTFGRIVKQMWNEAKDFSYPWKNEILPLFKKYVLSFASGYFLFQIYTPLMHLFHGAEYSGKVGITMTLVNAAFSFGNIFIYTITPQINMLVEKRDWVSLDNLFKKRLVLSLVTYFFIWVCFAIFVRMFGDFAFISKILERFMSYKGIAILALCYFFQLIINSWAIYLRGHKQEPYWLTGIFASIWVFLLTLFVGKMLSPDLFFIGLLSQYIWGLPVSYVIYKNNKKKWHI